MCGRYALQEGRFQRIEAELMAMARRPYPAEALQRLSIFDSAGSPSRMQEAP